MKNIVIASLVALVAGSFLVPAGSAEATMYVDTEERRNGLLGTFVLISGMIGGLCIVFALITRDSGRIEASAEPTSVVVPPTKQESNIVPHLITA